MNEFIDLEDGKYKVCLENSNKLYAERYGKVWRHLTGDKLILAMFNKIKELEFENSKLQLDIDFYRSKE